MEWVQRFRAAGAAADLDDLGVEVDDDMGSVGLHPPVNHGHHM